jgi:pyruvate formate lyase activating enzyme
MRKPLPDIDFIKGWVRTSLIDFPGKIATVIYTGGCNLRCPFCHNPELLNGGDTYETIAFTEVLEFLKLRAGVIDGIVVSGGEPLIHKSIFNLLHKLREFDIKIKLDTNGCYPERLQRILELQLVDMVAMDIKASKETYAEVVGMKNDMTTKIDASLHILKASSIPFELRTTILPNFHTKQMMMDIVQWIAPVDHYYLQQFRPEVTLDDSYKQLQPVSESKLKSFQLICQQEIPHTEIRGLST